MTKTLSHRLRDACQARGYDWVSQPDEPVLSPPYEKAWGCVYERASGHVAVLVTSARPKDLVRELLEGLDRAPPVVRSSREGTVLHSESGAWDEENHIWRRGQVEVTFENGTGETYPHPIGVPIRAGWPVTEVQFEGHDGPLIFWGPEHTPRRLTYS